MFIIEGDFLRGKGGCFGQNEVGINKAAKQPDEGLLELVIALGGDVVVLQILFTMESDLLGFDLSVLHVDFVAYQDDGDGLADSGQVLIPFRHIRVSDTRAHVEHDNAAVAANIVAVAQTSELLLASGIPNVENDLSVVREERHWVNFDSDSGDVLLFVFTGQVALDEGSLADSAVTDKNELEFRNLLLDHLQKVSRI